MSKQYRHAKRLCQKAGFLYFAESECRKIIKFGFTTDVRRRMSQWSEYTRLFGIRLVLLGYVPANQGAEMLVRQRFRKDLVHRSEFTLKSGGSFNDWLHANPELLGFIIETIRSGQFIASSGAVYRAIRERSVNATDEWRTREAKMTAEEKTALAKKAAEARWGKKG